MSLLIASKMASTNRGFSSRVPIERPYDAPEDLIQDGPKDNIMELLVLLLV